MEIQKISRIVNGIPVEQRAKDGFVNGTAMCVAHGKEVKEWFSNRSTIELLEALAEDLGIEVKQGISPDSGIAKISAAYPGLVVGRRGSPENGGGTWIHPDLAVQLAQWCSPRFAIQVSRWVIEWMTTGTVQVPAPSPLDEQNQRLDLIQRSIDMLSRLDGLDQQTARAIENSILTTIVGQQVSEPSPTKTKWKGAWPNQPETRKTKLSVVQPPQELTGKTRLAIRNHLLQNRGIKFTAIDLAKALGLSRYTIRKEMPPLVREGFVECELNPDYKYGQNQQSLYYYFISAAEDESTSSGHHE